jgi:hypothetical protein
MLSLRKPSADSICRFLNEQEKLSFSYAAVGATAETPPPGFNVDHCRIKLGCPALRCMPGFGSTAWSVKNQRSYSQRNKLDSPKKEERIEWRI